MNKLTQRLLTFFIGLPLVIFIVYIPIYNHLPLNILIVIVAFISSLEAYNLIRRNSPMQPKVAVVCFSTTIALTSLICSLTGMDYTLVTFVFVAAFIVLMALEIFIPANKNETVEELFVDSNQKLCSSIFVLFYGGFLITFISRMTVLENSIPYLIVFLMMVFICDSLAWLFGMCFGKNNRGFVKASPNKSIVGFIGGIIGSVLSGILGWYIWRDVFTGSITKMIIAGIVVAIASILGDLVESVFKRSAGCKDSGNIIPGRGGILDSIDSILMTAPVYYLIIKLMFE
ncbi:MAG: phosphatidate cytidylyltransferase [Spirochaetaceae bacterium]|nr:phosphatidate cytidylyltransferase [Spirochaetaceae bacterium]